MCTHLHRGSRAQLAHNASPHSSRFVHSGMCVFALASKSYKGGCMRCCKHDGASMLVPELTQVDLHLCQL